MEISDDPAKRRTRFQNFLSSFPSVRLWGFEEKNGPIGPQGEALSGGAALLK